MPFEDVGVHRHTGLPAVPPHAEEVGGVSLRAPFLESFEGRMLASHVVEDTVEQHPDAAVVGGRDEAVEIEPVAQPRVDAEVIGRVVAVRARREHRPEQQPVEPELDGVIEPRLDTAEPVLDGLVRAGSVRLRVGEVRPDRCSRESQRVHVPPHDGLGPIAHPGSQHERMPDRERRARRGAGA
ncbi:hypothetical protein QE367_000997 [Microbacterium paludicola]|uniref:DUF2382 domain-containing protein n=1 Tax=Microbacterium paludicola TaxID=300019 RepID=A0ABU1I128_9MICO|nr:hypothetical protein [Microbacterium paludicola]